MYLCRVLAGTFSQVRFGQDVGISNDRFRQFSLYLSLRSLFCLLLSGRFTQVLLYMHLTNIFGLNNILFR